MGNHFAPATSFWNLGFLRSGSKMGSILCHPGERSLAETEPNPSQLFV
jgi:hypothetical protein